MVRSSNLGAMTTRTWLTCWQGTDHSWTGLEMLADCKQFHVDNLSSAHVYLRMKTGESWASIPQDLLEDCAQLTKANSIEGTKSSAAIWSFPASNEMNRQQERQHHDHLHPVGQLAQRCIHGYRSSLVP